MLQGFCWALGHLEVSRELGGSWEQALTAGAWGCGGVGWGWMGVGL